MKPFALLLTLFAFINVNANNDLHGHVDRNEIRVVKEKHRTLNVQYQYQLRNQPNWQNFLLENGMWYVQFNEANGKPHKAYGTPISVSGSSIEDKARNFISSKLNGFGIPENELEVSHIGTSVDFNRVFFKQVHNGKEVLFSRLSIKMTLEGDVISFGLDVHDNVEVEQAVLSASEASAAARQNLQGDVTSVEGNSTVKIFPVPEYDRKRTTFRPVYEVTVNTLDENGIPGIYLTYVDAVNGNIIMRKNLVCHAKSTPGGPTATVTDDVSLTNPTDPETNSPLANLEVTQGGNTFFADQNGLVTGLSTGNATFIMRGLWSEVFTNGNTPTMTVNLTNGPNAVDWGNNSNSKESSAFYHVNIVHDYMKTKFPSFTNMDNPLTTNVDVNGSCNAFYNGNSINFYLEGAGCTAWSLIGDVVYHEYGHGINDKYYQSQGAFWQNGAMGEGYADLWGLGITDFPIIGLGNSQSLPNDYIRRYDIDPKIYPQDLIGEVHADGEIIAGAWWDLGQNFGDLQQMMDLFAATFDATITGFDGNEGEVFVDILIEALQVDDAPSNGGDNDITNGTPNDLDIIDAFDAHGITLLSNATLNHTPIEAHDDQAIDIDATIINDYPWALNDTYVYYSINEMGTWSSVTLSNTGGNNYSGSIPAQANGTIVAYFVALENLNGTLANVQPIAANLIEPNLPNYILVGYIQNRIEDFDNFQDNDWQEGLPSDNNSTGTWTIDIPTGSFTDDNVMVQTDSDHTPGAGNVACAFTGNANANDAVGTNDVDDGHTTLVTPAFDLSEYSNPAISYWRYYTNSPPTGANPGADWWQVLISDDGSDWVFVENTKVSDPSWRRKAIRVTDYVDLTSEVKIKFIASDSTHLGQNLDGGSLIEGAVDDVEIWEIAGGAQSGIEETEISQLSVYPNPSHGNITLSINLNDATDISVEIFNLSGAVVHNKHLDKLGVGSHQVSVELAHMSSGVYQMRLITEKGATTQRIEILN